MPGIEASKQFAGSLRDPREARRFAASTLCAWGLESLVQDCTLVVSELTSNVVLHASSPFTLTLRRRGDGVQVTVFDLSSDPAALVHSDPSQPGGRGLRVVEAIAARWGQTAAEGGKQVWAVLGATE